MSNLSVDFKDDILASSNPKRKYQLIHNSDGTVSLEDVTVYQQNGSNFGAKEVNEERTAINKINNDRIVSLDEIDLVNQPGFFVDALAVKELNSALSKKSNTDHLHDGRYYTESEVDEKVNEVRSKRTQLTAGDYYYSGSIAFYVYGNGVVQVDGYTATMKQSIPLSSYSVIGYIPSGLYPNNEFYFPCFAGGKIIGMVALSSNGNISLFPYQDVKGVRLTFNACYINF